MGKEEEQKALCQFEAETKQYLGWEFIVSRAQVITGEEPSKRIARRFKY